MARFGRGPPLAKIDIQQAYCNIPVSLNADARSDIEWWYQYITPWNGKGILPNVLQQPTAVLVCSDASGMWGCRAVWGPFWFQLEWADLLQGANISIKELTPIVIAAAIWRHHWKGKCVRALSDNSAAVAAINNQLSRVKESAYLLHCLAFIAGHLQIQLSVTHLLGATNSIADVLSRNNLSLFLALHPQAARSPSPIPSSFI